MASVPSAARFARPPHLHAAASGCTLENRIARSHPRRPRPEKRPQDEAECQRDGDQQGDESLALKIGCVHGSAWRVRGGPSMRGAGG